MAVGGSSVSVEVNTAAVRALTRDRFGPLARDLARRAERATQEAKRLCPTSPSGSGENPSGFLRSSIGWSISADVLGLYADIGTDTEYALAVEYGTKPHVIESKGDYPLRSADGTVFGRRVNHPGTQAQPFLRPCVLRAR